MTDTKPTVNLKHWSHCWESGPLAPDGCPMTCMREFGHRGEHAWTRDDAITFKFADEKPVGRPVGGGS